jgi:hypothetical protein
VSGVPRSKSEPTPEFVTVTEADAGVMPAVPSVAVKVRELVLSVRIGWLMTRSTSTDCCRSPAPVAVIGTDTVG